jgi:hypothetical protein
MTRGFAVAAVFFSIGSFAQTQFVRNTTVPVFIGTQQLNFAWAGGMNFCQFSEIDLDQDGVNDLFIFDRSGNKISTFLNGGTPSQVDYAYSPQFIPQFPRLYDWALLRDYNCDNRADIFTGNVSGIRVYKNISTGGNLQFQLVTNTIMEDRTPNSTHLVSQLGVSWIDIPAIRDVDGDGDLDILNFGVGGTQVEFHRNLSMENSGGCDSLVFRLESFCWGEFTESQLDATITLSTTCSPPPLETNAPLYHSPLLHAGSCLECINTDGDADQDLLVGDLANFNINLVRNGGSASFAFADSVDEYYPGYDTPAAVTIFGCGFHLDVDNDGNKDILFSSNNNAISENFRSAWYYHNTGANDSVRSQFVTDRFLVDGMIDVGEGAVPVFFDFDSDGDQDLFIGNRGYFDINGIPLSMIALFRNDGTAAAPSFILQTTDFAGINSQALNVRGPAPAFGDLDGDGDADMLVGDVNGYIHFFRKDPGSDTNFVLAQGNYIHVNGAAFLVPQLVDVNRDGLLDLLVGKQNGMISYYRNDGTASAANFTLITTFFGNVYVTQSGFTTGYSAPFLYDDNGDYVLYVGSERGFLFRYENIDGNLAGNFTLTDSLFASSWEGGRITESVTDLNNDGLADMVIGNYAGGVSLFYGDNSIGMNETHAQPVFSIFPNPLQGSHDVFRVDCTNFPAAETILIYDCSGKIIHEEKIASEQTTILLPGLSPGLYLCVVKGRNGFCANQKLIITR